MYCSSCGNQFDPSARFCANCGATRNVSSGFPPPFAGEFKGRGQLVRPRSPRVIAGVCSGLAEHYGWDLNLVRLAAVLLTLLTGVGLLAYIVAWVVIPDGQYALPFAVPPPPQTTATTESVAH